MNLPTPASAFHWSVEPWGQALRCRPLASIAQHAFTTRQLELRPALPGHGQITGWTHATASVGAGVEQLMRVRQVHGRALRILRRGEVSPNDADARPQADAIVADVTDLVLAVQVADCVPILMADRASGAAAAVHAGWRGTCAGVATATVDALSAQFGTEPGNLTVAIGPSIGPCCYEVGPELLEAFRDAGTSEAQVARWFVRSGSGSWRLNLWAANVDQLKAAGVPEGSIHLSGLCTKTHADVFDSYRVDGERAGRMAALIKVPPHRQGYRLR